MSRTSIQESQLNDRNDAKADAGEEHPIIRELGESFFEQNAELDDESFIEVPMGLLRELASTLPPSASKPVTVEEIARAICEAKGVNPDCLHQNWGDEAIDHTDARGKTFHYGWRNQLHIATAILALINARTSGVE